MLKLVIRVHAIATACTLTVFHFIPIWPSPDLNPPPLLMPSANTAFIDHELVTGLKLPKGSDRDWKLWWRKRQGCGLSRLFLSLKGHSPSWRQRHHALLQNAAITAEYFSPFHAKECVQFAQFSSETDSKISQYVKLKGNIHFESLIVSRETRRAVGVLI